MKLLQANPKIDATTSLYRKIVEKERELRHNNRGTFRRVSKDKWNHKNFYGWIKLTNTPDNIFFAKLQSKNYEQEERLLESFVGFLTRHCGDLIDSLTIYYR
jgi:hypothetical protein